MHPQGHPVRIQSRLREKEIQIGPLAGMDQLRRQQMKTLIPGNSRGLRINQQSREQQGNGRVEQQEGPSCQIPNYIATMRGDAGASIREPCAAGC